MSDPYLAKMKREAQAHVRIAEKRLAGNKRFEVAVFRFELTMRKGGNLSDFIAHRLTAIGACRDCKGLFVEQRDDINRDAKVFRYRCGRSKRHERLTCDDGTTVYINYAEEVEPVEVIKSPLIGKSYDSMIMDEVVYFPGTDRDEKDFMKMKQEMSTSSHAAAYTQSMEEVRREKQRSKDTPRTLTESDAW